MSTDWYGHLQVLHRTTGNTRFEFTHGITVMVHQQPGNTCVVMAYIDENYQFGGDNFGPRLSAWLSRFVRLELVSMGESIA